MTRRKRGAGGDFQVEEIVVKKVETRGPYIVITCDVPQGSWMDNMPADQNGQKNQHLNHEISMEPAAVADRMLHYGLATPEEAVQAILREHCVRLGDVPPDSPPAHKRAVAAIAKRTHTREDLAIVTGGLNRRAKVTVTNAQLTKVKTDHGDVIAEIHQQMSEADADPPNPSQ